MNKKGDGAQQKAQDNHRMQPDQSPPEEILHFQSTLPPIVIGITDNKSGEDEEEIDSQISVVKPLIDGAGCEPFENMVENDHQGCNPAQSVEYLIVRFSILYEGG